MATTQKINIKTELLAGLATFLSCSYIIAVNPAILSTTGASFSSLLTATVLVSAVSTIAMGLYAKNPLLVAPGMGINAFVAYTMVAGMNIPYETALGAIFLSGLLFISLSLFKIRELIARAIPLSLQRALSCGIGIFISFIGLKNASVIIKHPETLVSIGPLNASTLTFFVGLLFLIALILKRVRGAICWAIIATTLLAIPLGRWWGQESVVTYRGFFEAPDFSLFLALDLWGALKIVHIPALFTLLLTDLFDSLSTFVGISQGSGLVDKNGHPLRIKKSLLVDAFATALSGISGTSPATTYIESAVGIHQGGRTGLVSLTAGILFLPFLFLSPLLSTIPVIATAPALVLTGIAMMKPIRYIPWEKSEEAIPAFVAMTFMPLTFSITNGIIGGFLSYTFCKIVIGKHREIPRTLYAINILCLLLLLV